MNYITIQAHFYNMVIHWLENGAKESPEDMANEFLRIANARD